MKIIEQSHVIEHITPNILQKIERYARNCYKSEDKIGCIFDPHEAKECPDRLKVYNDESITEILEYVGCDPSCQHHSSHKMVKTLIKKDHEAMLEFGDIVVRLITNRGVTHELVRHRIGMSYAQESTRYVRYDGKMEFIRPVWFDELSEFDRNIETWKSAMLTAESHYGYLLNGGWRPEQAREVLPNSLKTEIVVKGNVRSFRHLFQLRTSKKSHPQIRSLMTNLLIDLKKQIPVVFDDIGGENG